MVATHVFFLWSVRERITRGDPDFTVFYTAGKLLREGRAADLYDGRTQQAVQREFANDADIRKGPLPFIHPPFEAVVFAPLTYFSYPTAFAVWSVLNLGILYTVAIVLRNSVGFLRTVSAWEAVVACLAFFPVFANFHQGQDALLLLLVVALGYRALAKDTDFLAGCWLGFGIFKYHLIVPLVLILAIWRGRRLIAGFLTVSASLALVSLAIVGWHGALEYPNYTWNVVSHTGFGGIPLRQLPNILGLVSGWPIGENVGWLTQATALLSAALLVLMVAWLRLASRDRRRFPLCVSCAIVTALLVGYSTNTYDLSLLVLPFALIADYYLQNSVLPGDARSSLIAPAVPLLLSPLWFFLWLRWERINVIALFLVWWIFAIRREILRLGVPQVVPQRASVLS